MALRFAGTLEELKAKLAKIEGEWRELNPNQKQLRAKSGAILNWYPSTGSINFQGNSPALETLEGEVAGALTGQNSPAQITAAPAPAVPGIRGPAAPKAPEQAQPSNLGAPAAASLAQREAVQARKPFAASELVFALVGAVGTQLERVRTVLEERLKVIGYSVTHIHVSKDVIQTIAKGLVLPDNDEHGRIKALMDAGDKARKDTGDNSILASGAAAFINSKREKDEDGQPKHMPRRAYIISSLKHPEEVARLREIYPLGFYLIGVHADEKRRFEYLTVDRRISALGANELMERDEDDHLPHGQRLIDTFHLSDFFVRIDGHDDQLKFSLWRVLDLLFSNPYVTPTFDEYAMFLAFAASLRSADLSRQVGAVVAVNEQVVATGANDCPKAGGGLYWPEYNPQSHKIEDQADGRDYMLKADSNKIEQAKIIEQIVGDCQDIVKDADKLRSALKKSRISDLTEFGRVVHAEMEALLSCARARITTSGGTVYSTTFPCHNCAKHIIAAGIRRVVFIEPYQKSKAAEFHTDSIHVGFIDPEHADDERLMVHFEPFVGVGPRRFFDLFSLRLGSGYPLKRKDDAGHTIEWIPEDGRLRLQMLPFSYLDLEFKASDVFNEARKE